MCTATGSILAEHRSQLCALSSQCCEIQQAQSAFLEDYSSIRKAHIELLHDHSNLRREHAFLREEYEVLRDCLAVRGVLKTGDLSARSSMRRASKVLGAVLEAQELVEAIGTCMGVTASRSLSEVSKLHGGGVRVCMPTLLRRFPLDVYVVGGKNDSKPALAAVERFSPGTGEWGAVPPMRTARYGCAASAVGGKLYVVGGHDGTMALASAERFDPIANRWEVLPSMPTARSRCAAVALRGKLYVLGGRDGSRNSTPLATSERFDCARGSWEVLPAMSRAPLGPTAARLGEAIYVMGSDADRKHMSIERLDHRTLQWKLLRTVPKLRFGCAAASGAGAFHVFGGHDGNKAVDAAERFVPSLSYGNTGGRWEPLPPAPTARHGCAAVSAGGALYILGGDTGKTLVAAERFDPVRMRWESLPPLPTGRFGCAAAATRR